MASKIKYKPLDFNREREAIWEIFCDCAHMISDETLNRHFGEHKKRVHDADDLFNILYHDIHILCLPNHLGCYIGDKLIGISYVTDIGPCFDDPDRTTWEADYHGLMHPDFRKPEFTDTCFVYTTNYFLDTLNLDYLVFWVPAYNRAARIALHRCGVNNRIAIDQNHKIHAGQPVDYVAYISGGAHV